MDIPISAQAGPSFEPWTRTSLQSFRFLPQILRKPRHIRAVEITRTSLQSFLHLLFDAFCYAPFVNHDCASHTPGGSPDSPSDTRMQGEYDANAYCGHFASNNSLCFSLPLPYWSFADEHFGMPWQNNTSVSWFGDYFLSWGHNVDRWGLKSWL